MSALWRSELTRFLAALQFFTRVPVPAWVGHAPAPLAVAVRYFPAIGLLVGAVGAGVFLLLSSVLPSRFAVLAALAAMTLLTGALHEDGLADTADGLGGGYTRERVLAIMKDSRIGAYGACALLFSVQWRWEALASLNVPHIAGALVAVSALSRAAPLLVMVRLPYVRDDDSSRARPLVEGVGRLSLVIGLVTGILPLYPLAGAGLLALIAVAVVTVLWIRTLRRRLGGYTGDCLGALQQLAEMTAYTALAAAGT